MEVAITRESLCEKWYCSVSHRDGDIQKYLAFPMRCKSWDCPTCRRIKSQEYRGRISMLKNLPALYMYTFTYAHNSTLDEAWQHYNSAWNRLRTRLVQIYGRFNYVRVLEPHKNVPYPHVHVIADKWFLPTILGPAAFSAGFGYQMEGHKIDGVEALAYISKYLSKSWPDNGSIALRKQYRCRIISFSRGMLSPKTRSTAWQMLVYGTDLGSCLDHILTDYTWRTSEKGEVVYSEVDENHAEVHVLFESCPPPGAFSFVDSIADLAAATG